jgi:hypothetical protein
MQAPAKRDPTNRDTEFGGLATKEGSVGAARLGAPRSGGAGSWDCLI